MNALARIFLIWFMSQILMCGGCLLYHTDRTGGQDRDSNIVFCWYAIPILAAMFLGCVLKFRSLGPKSSTSPRGIPSVNTSDDWTFFREPPPADAITPPPPTSTTLEL